MTITMVEAIHQSGGPPPGFEHFRPSDRTAEQKVVSKVSVQKASDPNGTRGRLHDHHLDLEMLDRTIEKCNLM